MDKVDKAGKQITDLAELRDDPDAVWPSEAAARFLGVSKGALARWRHTGEGPAYVALSKTRVGYTRRSMIEWREKRTRQSTSDATASTASLPEAKS